MSRFSMDDRVAIITGAGSGIGRSVAYLLAEHGAHVVVAGRRREPLEHTAKEVEGLGRRALVAPTDVTRPGECHALIEAAMDGFGRIDVLVNNAGGSPIKPIEQWTGDEWDGVVDLNLGSVWHLSRAAAAPMIDRGKGSIVNISSGGSFHALPTMAPYGAAKAGVNSLTSSMAAAWTSRGVRVNAIAAGIVRTEQLLQEATRLGVDPESFASTNAMNRLGEPEEIGYAVLYFASDASSFCSGATLWVGGGSAA